MEEFDDNDFSDFEEIFELIKQYEDAENRNKSVYFEEDSFEQIIDYYLENREYDRAANAVAYALSIFPASVVLLIKNAEIFAEQTKFQEALIIIDRALELSPNHISLHLLKADVYLGLHEHSLAHSSVNFALSLTQSPEDLCDIYLLEADIYEDQEDYEAVLNSLKKAVAAEPANDEAFARIWYCSEILDWYKESVTFHKDITDKYPYHVSAWFNLGHAYYALGEYENAIDALEFVLAIDEYFDSAYYLMGETYLQLDNYAKAVDFFLEVGKYTKPTKELFMKIAECYVLLGENHKAKVHIRKAINLDPQYDFAYYRLAELYKLEEQYESALKCIQRAIKNDTENIDYLSSIADCYMMLNSFEEAIPYLNKRLEIDDSVSNHFIELSLAYLYLGEFEVSNELIDEAISRFYHEADIRYIKFILLYKSEAYKDAFATLESALAHNYEAFPIIFKLEPSLEDNATVLQLIEQYRSL